MTVRYLTLDDGNFSGVPFAYRYIKKTESQNMKGHDVVSHPRRHRLVGRHTNKRCVSTNLNPVYTAERQKESITFPSTRDFAPVLYVLLQIYARKVEDKKLEALKERLVLLISIKAADSW